MPQQEYQDMTDETLWWKNLTILNFIKVPSQRIYVFPNVEIICMYTLTVNIIEVFSCNIIREWPLRGNYGL